jgi:hypothetical protein
MVMQDGSGPWRIVPMDNNWLVLETIKPSGSGILIRVTVYKSWKDITAGSGALRLAPMDNAW